MGWQVVLKEIAKETMKDKLSSQLGKDSKGQLDTDNQNIDLASKVMGLAKKKVSSKLGNKTQKPDTKLNRSPEEKMKDSINPAKEKYNNNILQQAGRAFVGMDVNEGLDMKTGVWGSLGRTLGDTMRGRLGLDTTSERGGASVQDAMAQYIMGQIGGGIQPQSQPGVTGGGNLNQTQNPQELMDSYVSGQKGKYNISAADFENLEGSIAGKLGGQTNQSKIIQDLDKEAYKQTLETRLGALQGIFNLETGSDAMSDIDELVANAFEKGSIGDLPSALKTKASLLWGGKGAEENSDAAALSGRITETVLRIMPTFTQQAGEAGSVRIINGIFDEVLKSYGGGGALKGMNIPPKNMKKLLVSSLKGNFKMAKALQNYSQEKIKILNGIEDDTTFKARVKKIADGVKLTEEENEAFDYLENNIFQKIDAHIAKRDGNEIGEITEEKKKIRSELQNKYRLE